MCVFPPKRGTSKLGVISTHLRLANNKMRRFIRQTTYFGVSFILCTVPTTGSSTPAFHRRHDRHKDLVLEQGRRIPTSLFDVGLAPSSIQVPRGGASTTKRKQHLVKNGASSVKARGVSIPSPTLGSNKQMTDGASISNMIFNLVKSIVGAGVLGLPAGVAAFGSTNLALIPSIALIGIIGMLSGYCFSLIGRTCAYTSSVSYRQAWERSVSAKTSWLPALACFMVTSCSVLAYSMILSDTVPTLLEAFTPYKSVTRTQALLGVTTVALLPLCLMKSLKALGPFSLVGIIGMIYTSLAMALRFFDGSYQEGGRFFETLPANLAPSFAGAGSTSLLDLFSNPNLFILVSMLSTAYMVRLQRKQIPFLALKFDLTVFVLSGSRLITTQASSIGNWKTTR